MPNNEEQLISNKLWLSVSQAAKLFGVEQKTIRRAIKNKEIAYLVESERYSIEMGSLILWAHNSARLKNKLDRDGMGKFVEAWKKEFIKQENIKT